MSGDAEKIKTLIEAGDALKDAAKSVADHVSPSKDFAARADRDDLAEAERQWNLAAGQVDPTDYNPC